MNIWLRIDRVQLWFILGIAIAAVALFFFYLGDTLYEMWQLHNMIR